jgi:hypothetical protein
VVCSGRDRRTARGARSPPAGGLGHGRAQRRARIGRGGRPRIHRRADRLHPGRCRPGGVAGLPRRPGCAPGRRQPRARADETDDRPGDGRPPLPGARGVAGPGRDGRTAAVATDRRSGPRSRLPVVLPGAVRGARSRTPPPGRSAAGLRSDPARADPRRGRGHHGDRSNCPRPLRGTAPRPAPRGRRQRRRGHRAARVAVTAVQRRDPDGLVALADEEVRWAGPTRGGRGRLGPPHGRLPGGRPGRSRRPGVPVPRHAGPGRS